MHASTGGYHEWYAYDGPAMSDIGSGIIEASEREQEKDHQYRLAPTRTKAWMQIIVCARREYDAACSW